MSRSEGAGIGRSVDLHPTGLSIAPQCRVTTEDGVALVLGEPDRYQQSVGMESSYGFTASSGATYTVSCGISGQSGLFAVAEVDRFPVGRSFPTTT